MKKKIIIVLLVIFAIFIMISLNVIKQKKMEPYVGYWRNEREEGPALYFQFNEDGTGFYEFPEESTKKNYFEWSIKNNKAVLGVGEGDIKINFEFEFNETGELNSSEMPGPYKKVK